MTAPASNSVTWFEVGSTKPDEAQRFYGELFGWTFAGEGYQMVTTPGADHASGGLMPLPDGTPGHAIFYVQVDDVAATSKRVEELGGKVVLPATKTPDGLEFSHVTDAEGNRFGLWNPSAG